MVAGSAGGVARAGAAAPADPEAQQLRTALALARTDSFYLVLDLRQANLTLMLGAVPLRSFSYVDAAVGRPRLGFGEDQRSVDWLTRIWRDGTLDPASSRKRRQIEAPAPDATGTPPPAAIPPTVEESSTPPSRYCLRFSGGFSLEIRRVGAASAWYRPAALLDRLGRHRPDALRVRLSLSQEDADTLYRCLPPGLALIVVGRPEAADGEP